MPITLNGSGTITGVSSLATALVNPVVTTTMGVGNATPAASGAGITFPAAQSASSDANTLDDYEEGTWTPTVGGTWTTNPTSLSGSYVKVGKVVTLNVVFINGAKATATSGWIGGLPFVTVTNGGGTCVDSDITSRGLCYTGNDTRIWYTNTAFSAGGNAAQITYYV